MAVDAAVLDAANIVCGYAETASEAQLFLDMLGMLEEGELVRPRAHILEVRNIRNVGMVGRGNH